MLSPSLVCELNVFLPSLMSLSLSHQHWVSLYPLFFEQSAGWYPVAQLCLTWIHDFSRFPRLLLDRCRLLFLGSHFLLHFVQSLRYFDYCWENFPSSHITPYTIPVYFAFLSWSGNSQQDIIGCFGELLALNVKPVFTDFAFIVVCSENQVWHFIRESLSFPGWASSLDSICTHVSLSYIRYSQFHWSHLNTTPIFVWIQLLVQDSHCQIRLRYSGFVAVNVKCQSLKSSVG